MSIKGNTELQQKYKQCGNSKSYKNVILSLSFVPLLRALLYSYKHDVVLVIVAHMMICVTKSIWTCICQYLAFGPQKSGLGMRLPSI